MAQRRLPWAAHIPINIYWLGINLASGSITPVILPFLVALFVPPASKNTLLANLRVVGLAIAMMVQPMAGALSDRNTSRWGRRRPFIALSAVLNVVFLLLLGAAPLFLDSPADGIFERLLGVNTAYMVLLLSIVLLQFSSNLGHGALQGLIPDLVPADQRGLSSGVKSVMELLPVFLVIAIGPLVDGGRLWVAIGIIAAGFLITMLATVLFVHEQPLRQPPRGPLRGTLLRLVALAAIFVTVSQAAVWLVRVSGARLTAAQASQAMQVALVGLAGLAAMAGSILLGVYLGAWVGIGSQARRQRAFIWWVINRLLFLAAVGSIQAFAQFFLSDVLRLPNAATMTTVLLAVVALFLLPAALAGGRLADRLGRVRLVGLAALVAAAGTALLLFARSVPLVVISGSIIGLGAGVFFAANWALGTDLVPRAEAGRYLGISNLAGAGAGIVGAGIGGPMADYFNALQAGLGYQVIFAIYGGLFLLSILALRKVQAARSVASPSSP